MLMIPVDESLSNADVRLAAMGSCEFCWNDVTRVREYAKGFVFTCENTHEMDILYTHHGLGSVVNDWELWEFDED
mgnify:CR=1 FL=1